MRRLLLVAGLVALAQARPDTYKEKEDFQYSRSSTDEGSKSGFYGAQRGNMGGNYEKAHNMDTLAQSQMSGIMRQVHGELGPGINTPKGNVYGAASSRGTYGQGNYDLSNLSGRNFEETDAYGESSHASSAYKGQSSSSATSNGHASSYSSRNRYGNSERQTADNLETDSVSAGSNYHKGYERSSGYNSGYQSQSRYSSHTEGQRQHRDFENIDNVNDNSHYRITPLKVILRPGSKVNIPLTAKTNMGRLEDFDENSINQEAKSDRQNNQAKSYQSSFSYRKEWEKHHSQPKVAPLAIPTAESSYDAQSNNEYENQQAYSQYANSRRSQGVKGSSYTSGQPSYHDAASSYDQTYGKSSSMSHARDEYGYNQQAASNHGSSSSSAKSQSSNAYRNVAGSQNQIESSEKNPKRYESSYSYHKSWERVGDPYVIYPDSDGTQTYQRITDVASNEHAYGSQQYIQSQEKKKARDALLKSC